MKSIPIIIFISICLLCVSCDRLKDKPKSGTKKGVEQLQQNKDGHYQLFCNNFPHLNYINKLFAWHLYTACISGQNFIYDQIPPNVEDSLSSSFNPPSDSTIQAIRQVIAELEKAVGFAPVTSASSIIDFIRCLDDICQGFHVNSSKTYTGSSDNPVNFIFGFEQLASDSGISRFAFNGMVLIKDDAADSLIAEYEGLNAETYQLLYTTSGDGHIPVGTKINNYDDKKITYCVFSNVLETYDQAQRQSLLEGFFKGDDTAKQTPEHTYTMPELKQIKNRMAGVRDVVIVYRGLEK